MNKNLIVAIAAIVLLIIGGFVGYKLKRCPVIESQVVKYDTVFVEKPIVDIQKVSYPVNIPFSVYVPGKTKYVHDPSGS